MNSSHHSTYHDVCAAAAAGNPNVMVCERGTMFGYSDLIVDPRNFVLMRDAACPVTADITHALQQPAGRTLEARAADRCASLDSCLSGIGYVKAWRWGR